jgi:hypothetical protein
VLQTEKQNNTTSTQSQISKKRNHQTSAVSVYFILIIKEKEREKKPDRDMWPMSAAAAKPTPCKNVDCVESGEKTHGTTCSGGCLQVM